MNWNNSHNLVINALLFFVAIHFNANVAAQDSETTNADQWQYQAAVYLWVADIGGKTANGTSVDISFSDLADNLDMAFMGAFSASKGKWVFVTDMIYMDVSAKDTINTSIPVGPGEIEVTAKAKLGLTGLVFEFGGGYSLLDSKVGTLYVLGGARYLDLDTDVALTLEALGPEGSIKLADSGNVWDAIVGLKGRLALTERWSLPYYLDVGTGDSDLTYQANAGISYRAGDSINVALTYRYLKWDFGSDFSLRDFNFKGPMLGAVYRF